jgi:hypothetical protein
VPKGEEKKRGEEKREERKEKREKRRRNLVRGPEAVRRPLPGPVELRLRGVAIKSQT